MGALFYIAVTIWGIICFVGWVIGMRYFEKSESIRKRKS